VVVNQTNSFLDFKLGHEQLELRTIKVVGLHPDTLVTRLHTSAMINSTNGLRNILMMMIMITYGLVV